MPEMNRMNHTAHDQAQAERERTAYLQKLKDEIVYTEDALDLMKRCSQDLARMIGMPVPTTSAGVRDLIRKAKEEMAR